MPRRRVQINIQLDAELAALLAHQERDTGVGRAALVRDALREKYAVGGDALARGWVEGYQRGLHEARVEFARWIKTVSAKEPGGG